MGGDAARRIKPLLRSLATQCRSVMIRMASFAPTHSVAAMMSRRVRTELDGAAGAPGVGARHQSKDLDAIERYITNLRRAMQGRAPAFGPDAWQ